MRSVPLAITGGLLMAAPILATSQPSATVPAKPEVAIGPGGVRLVVDQGDRGERAFRLVAAEPAAR